VRLPQAKQAPRHRGTTAVQKINATEKQLLRGSHATYRTKVIRHRRRFSLLSIGDCGACEIRAVCLKQVGRNRQPPESASRSATRVLFKFAPNFHNISQIGLSINSSAQFFEWIEVRSHTEGSSQSFSWFSFGCSKTVGYFRLILILSVFLVNYLILSDIARIVSPVAVTPVCGSHVVYISVGNVEGKISPWDRV
jgi:hypothetical protein